MLQASFFLLFLVVVFLVILKRFYSRKKHQRTPLVVAEKELLPTGQILLKHNYVNRFPRDFELEYDKDFESYLFRGEILTYVEDAVDLCFPKFDEDKRALQRAQKTGEEPAYIKEVWASENKEAQQLGSYLHRQIENIILGKDFHPVYNYHYEGHWLSSRHPISIISEVNQFVAFWAEKKWTPFRSQWAIYDEDTGLVGFVDLLAENEQKELCLCDWTRSSRMGIENGAEFILESGEHDAFSTCPLLQMSDSPFNRKTLQLNILRTILKKQYHLQVDQMYLVIFHDSNKNFHEVKVPFLEVEDLYRSYCGHK